MKAIATILSKVFKFLVAALGSGNVLGWSVSILVSVAYIAIWVAVLTFVFSILSAYLAGLTSSMFGASSIPDGAMWLINQTFPVALFFKLTIGAIIFDLTAAKIIATAITASKKLK